MPTCKTSVLLASIILLMHTSWGACNSSTLIQVFTDDNFANITSTFKHIILMSYFPWDTIADDVLPIMNITATRFYHLKESRELCVGTLDLHKNLNTAKKHNLFTSPQILFLKNGIIITEYRGNTARAEYIINKAERFMRTSNIVFLPNIGEEQDTKEIWNKVLQKDEFTMLGFFNLNFGTQDENRHNIEHKALVTRDYDDIYDAFIVSSQSLQYSYTFALFSNNATSGRFAANNTTPYQETVVENTEPDQVRLLYLLVESFLNEAAIANKEDILRDLYVRNHSRGYVALYHRDFNTLHPPDPEKESILLSDWIVDRSKPIIKELTAHNFQSILNEGFPVMICFIDYNDSKHFEQLQSYKLAASRFYLRGINFMFTDRIRFDEYFVRSFPEQIISNRPTMFISIINPTQNTNFICEGCVDDKTITEFIDQYLYLFTSTKSASEDTENTDGKLTMLREVYRSTHSSTKLGIPVQKLSHDDLKAVITKGKSQFNTIFLLIYSTNCAISRYIRHLYTRLAETMMPFSDTQFLSLDVSKNDIPRAIADKIRVVPTIATLVTGNGAKYSPLCIGKVYRGIYHLATFEQLLKWTKKQRKSEYIKKAMKKESKFAHSNEINQVSRNHPQEQITTQQNYEGKSTTIIVEPEENIFPAQTQH